MRIERLSWAGIRIIGTGGTLLVDPLGTAAEVEQYMGPAREPLFAIGDADAALVTHLHPDHFDPAALRDAGEVFGPVGVDEVCAREGLKGRNVDVWQSVEVAGFRCSAIPAVDGLGDPQVSWVIDDGRLRVIHCGDTLWHGQWWRIHSRLGPFAAAFLCINGAVLRFPGVIPSEIEADLTPEQAAAAAAVLAADVVVPIHYGVFHFPPLYAETHQAEERFLVAAEGRGLRVRVLAPGEVLEFAAAP